MEMEDIEKWKGQLLMFTDQLRKKIEQIPETQLYVAAAVTTITLLLSFLVHLFKRKKLNTIVLAGVSGGGKTVLFYQLRDGSSHQGTVTSMDPNEDTCLLHSETTKKGKLKPVHLVDVPGHSRLRPKLDEYLPQAAGLIFMVDAVEFLHSCRQVAEYLYDILTKASVVKGRVPILILCNKTEKVSAHSKDFIRKQLEKEIDKLRTSRSSVSEADVTNEYTLGSPGQAFAFSHCINKVTVAEASALTVNGDCSYTSCGENMYPKNKITFPFRAYDQPMSCGLPGFDLGCNLSNRTPLLTFPSGQYFTVEGIYNHYLKEITISDPQGCLPEKLLHLNTSGTPFFFEKLANFTLYKCPSRIPSPHPACRGIYCTNGPPYSVLCSDNNSSIDGCELVGDVRVPNSSYYLTYYRSYEFTSASTASLTWDMTTACQPCMTSCRRSPKDFTKVKCNHLTSGDMAIIMTATLLLIVIVGISYAICKCRKRTSSRGATTSTPTEQHGTSASAGVAQGTLEAYPIMVVGESGRMLTNMDDKSCAICLSEYAPKDVLKMLPECLHSFHVVCIDEWLRANATCPICRTQPPLRP